MHYAYMNYRNPLVMLKFSRILIIAEIKFNLEDLGEIIRNEKTR